MTDIKNCHKPEFDLATKDARENRMSSTFHVCGTAREKDRSDMTLNREDPYDMHENDNVIISCYYYNIAAIKLEMTWVKSHWKDLGKCQL